MIPGSENKTYDTKIMVDDFGMPLQLSRIDVDSTMHDKNDSLYPNAGNGTLGPHAYE